MESWTWESASELLTRTFDLKAAYCQLPIADNASSTLLDVMGILGWQVSTDEDKSLNDSHMADLLDVQVDNSNVCPQQAFARDCIAFHGGPTLQ
eukprot:3738375-Amphidinium_carterae.1